MFKKFFTSLLPSVEMKIIRKGKGYFIVKKSSYFRTQHITIVPVREILNKDLYDL